TGNGSLVAVVGNYRDTPQLILRSVEEVLLTGLRCNGGTGDCTQPKTTISQQFDNVVDGEGVCQECWSNIAVKGGRYWEGTYDDFAWSGTNVIEASGYNSTDAELEIWMISPAFDLSTSNVPTLSFDSETNYDGDAIEVLVSIDYDGTSDPNIQGTWTALSPTLPTSTSSWSGWTASGDLDLSFNKGISTYIGFKYTGSASDGKTWEIDNIEVVESATGPVLSVSTESN
ncbi:DUF5017 domain-containing protein, partial [bacterium]|nr:DUF5017 domain-containing protein [bacterium]